MKRKVIAVTGKIGSGKSAVMSILRDMGCETIICDELAKQVADHPSVVKRVERLLGSDSVTDGQLNRKYIREIVFADENLLHSYEQIFFSGVKDLLTARVEYLQKNVTAKDCKGIFVEIPVLDAFDYPWDGVWRVDASEQATLSRVTARDNVSEESVLTTLSRQKDYECDCVIENNGNMDELAQAVKRAAAKI